jgi:hypothetical protein
MSDRGTWAAGLCLAMLVASATHADEEQEAEAAKRYQAYAKEMAAKYDLKTAGDQPRQLKLHEESLLRWTNPLGANKAHGELFLWTDRGRPAAVLSMYEYVDRAGVLHEHHEWCSLALGPIRASGPKEWSPGVAGIELKPLPGAPPPADTPNRRLRQMRELSAGFTGEKTTVQNETRTLRVMSQPTYRYEAGDPEIVDGALIALVEATDPEIFLCLEARLVNSKPVWHYGLARMNSVRVAASYQEKQVWEGPALAPRDTYNRKDLPYTALWIK